MERCMIPPSRPLLGHRLPLLAVVIVLSNCQHAPSIEVEDYRAPRPTHSGFAIQVGDLLNVHVWNQEMMSSHVRVREDGMVTLPLVGDIAAAGIAPTALAETLRVKLKGFLVEPVVTVGLEETRSLTIAVLGEVVRPGNYPLEHGSGVLQALAVAGGLSEYADRDRILVLRSGSISIRFRYAALSVPGGPAASFRLQAGDVVMVE
jgi:polysaccharide biosynthesis/export protein